MAPRLTTAAPATQVRLLMEQAWQRYRDESGQRVPEPRRSHGIGDREEVVTIWGATLTYGPLAEYNGPLGHWYATLNKHVGKPWKG